MSSGSTGTWPSSPARAGGSGRASPRPTPGPGRAPPRPPPGAGADLVLVARTVTDLGAVAAAVRALGRTALVIPADLTDVSRAAQIVERAVAEHGRLDILVSKAGGAMPARYLDPTPEALDQAFHFNV